MNDSDKKKLFILTGVIDLFLLLTIYFVKLNFIDKLWIFSVFISHSLFFNDFLSTLAMLNNIDLNNTSINRFLNFNINYKYISTVREINTILSQLQIQNINKTLKLVENTDRKKEKYTSQYNKNIQKCVQWCIKNQIPYNKFNQTNIFLNKK